MQARPPPIRAAFLRQILRSDTMKKRIASLFIVFAVISSLCLGVSAKPTADISKYNSVYSWQQASQNLDAVYIKATDGVSEVDYKLAQNVAGAESVGMAKGFYHFFYPGSEAYARDQADRFWAAIKDYSQQLIPICDVEVDNDCDADEISRDVTAFCDQLKHDGAPSVGIYTYRTFTELLTGLSQYPLWIADPEGTDGPGPFSNWGNWAAWQYSWTGSIDGIAGDVDLNQLKSDIYISSQQDSMLQLGSLGNSVITLQSNLNKLGYNLTADGSFGPLTCAAVVDFQRSHGLDPDGIVGPLTQSSISIALTSNGGVYDIQQKLNRLGYGLVVDGIDGPCTDAAIRSFQSICGIGIDGEYGPQSDSAYQAIISKPTLQLGSTGIAVRWIQHCVGVTIDGILGYETLRGVTADQTRHNISADGIVGYYTWNTKIH